MFREIEILSAAQVAELRGIAASAKFVDGRISNPHSKVKENLQLHDEAAYNRSSQILTQALYGSEEFQNFAFHHDSMSVPILCVRSAVALIQDNDRRVQSAAHAVAVDAISKPGAKTFGPI